MKKDKNKQLQKAGKKETSIVRSSAAEYLTFVAATDREILQDAGKVTAEIAKAHAESEFEKYRIIQDRLFESDFGRLMKRLEHKNDKNNED